MSDPEDQQNPTDGSEEAEDKSPLRLRRDDPAPSAGPEDPFKTDDEPAASAADGGDSEDDGESKPPAPPSPAKAIIKIIVALVVLVLGFKFGFGPLISHARGLKTQVIVKNTTETRYNLRLGWRMISQQLFPMSVAQFELDVGMPEKQGLLIKPIEPPGETFKIRVPMKPGGVTLVNLNKADSYYFYDPDTIAPKSLDLAELTRQIAGQQAPTAAEQVAAAAESLGDEAHLETTNEEFYELTDYEVRGAIGYYQANQENDDGKTVITNMPIDLQIDGAKIKHDPRADDNVEIQTSVGSEFDVQLDERTATIPASARLTVRAISGGGYAVDLHNSGVTIQKDGKEFVGTWRYRAAKAAGQNWSWAWDYEGRTKDTKFILKILVDKDGDSTENVTENEQRR